MFQGNDLARVLRWGPGYTGTEDPLNILRDVIDAEEIRLDRYSFTCILLDCTYAFTTYRYTFADYTYTFTTYTVTDYTYSFTSCTYTFTDYTMPLLHAHAPLLTICIPLLHAHTPLLTTRIPLLHTHTPLLTTHVPLLHTFTTLLTMHIPLLHTYALLLTTHMPLPHTPLHIIHIHLLRIHAPLLIISSGVHPLRMTTTSSSSWNVGFIVAEQANAREAMSATKWALINRIRNWAEHCSMLVSATASESCSSIVFSIKA